MKSLLGSALGVVNEAILETAINYQLGYGATITELWWNHVVWNLSTGTAPRPSVEKVDRHLVGAGPSSANPPPSRRQTASYRKRSDPSGWNDRKPAIFQGKKCEDLTHKDGRLEIQQKWKFVSPKIGICHMCQKTVKHQAVWNGASPIAWGYHSVWDPLL